MQKRRNFKKGVPAFLKSWAILEQWGIFIKFEQKLEINKKKM